MLQQSAREQIKWKILLCGKAGPGFEAGGLRGGGEQRKERRKHFSKKPGSFKPGGQQTPPPHAAARSIAERSGCELAPRGAAWSRGGGGRGGLGSPARRIGPGKQHPFPLLSQFNSHSARATPCRHRPLGQLSARQRGLGRGREGRRCQGGAAAAAGNYKGQQPLRHLPALFLPPLSARHQGLSQWGPSQRKRAPGSGCASGKACSLRRGSGQFTGRAKPSVPSAPLRAPLPLPLRDSPTFFL